MRTSNNVYGDRHPCWASYIIILILIIDKPLKFSARNPANIISIFCPLFSHAYCSSSTMAQSESWKRNPIRKKWSSQESISTIGMKSRHYILNCLYSVCICINCMKHVPAHCSGHYFLPSIYFLRAMPSQAVSECLCQTMFGENGQGMRWKKELEPSIYIHCFRQLSSSSVCFFLFLCVWSARCPRRF